MRIAFILPTFGAGGAERVAALLCNHWAGQGHEVTAITFESAGAGQVHAPGARVALRQIDGLNRKEGVAARVTTNARRVLRLRAALKALAPDVAVAFMTEAGVVTLWAAAGLSIPVVVSERNQPDRPGLGRWRRAARRMSYPLAAALVAQTDAIADWARQRFGVPVPVLPNPVDLKAWRRTVQAAQREKRLVAAGRLVRQKGFDLLIAAFAKIAAAHPGWTLAIYGEGPERAGLEAQIERLSIGGRVALPGMRKDMGGAFAEAGLFALPSRYEGYPNVLIEALAAGCPVIATDCPGANAEILDGGSYGLLVPPDDVDALAAALDRMMSDERLREKYAARGPEAVAALDVDQIGRRWLDLFASLRNA